jgi:methyltransferase family protein
VGLFEDIKRARGPIGYEVTEKGHLRMIGHHNPLSIKEAEFYFIKNYIVEHRLKVGFEVATAFGISALAAASGFAETGGKLASMDAYIEEQFNDAGIYSDIADKKFYQADGWCSAHFLASEFDVVPFVEFHIGWSPTDTPTVIESVHCGKRLDYVFIDGGHFSLQIEADVNAVLPYLEKSATVFFHDVYDDSFTPNLIEYFEQTLGGKMEIPLPYPEGENLGYIRTS